MEQNILSHVYIQILDTLFVLDSTQTTKSIYTTAVTTTLIMKETTGIGNALKTRFTRFIVVLLYRINFLINNNNNSSNKNRLVAVLFFYFLNNTFSASTHPTSTVGSKAVKTSSIAASATSISEFFRKIIPKHIRN